MPQDLMLLDIDGTIRPPSANGVVHEPPRPIGQMLRAIQKQITIVGATGASTRSARKTEEHLSMRFDGLAPSYCTRVHLRGGSNGPTVQQLVPQHEQQQVLCLNPDLEAICCRHNGKPDDRGPCFTKFLPDLDRFESAHEEVKTVTENVHGVRVLANSHDRGITVVGASATKDRIVEWSIKHSYRVVVAAGDTVSDAPLLEAAIFPIVTLTHENAEPCPELVAIVERKGCGYIARRPDGVGLIEGLKAARSARAIVFE